MVLCILVSVIFSSTFHFSPQNAIQINRTRSICVSSGFLLLFFSLARICIYVQKEMVCFIQLNKYYFRFICDDSCASSQGTLTKISCVMRGVRICVCLCSLVVLSITNTRYSVYTHV